MKRFALAILALCLLTVSAARAGLIALPPQVSLNGPAAAQRLVVVSEVGGKVVGDVTGQAKFESANPMVAKVETDGSVQAVGDGETVVTITHNGQTATVQVMVAKIKQPPAWSFRNHVVPIMTKAGCNSGACHGALAGKGGLKLSLRGYDPTADHFVLTRQAQGRRIDLTEPAQSLAVLKPTRGIKHGGGKKIEPDSFDYNLLVEWISAGASEPRDGDVAIQRLEVFPTAATLKPEDKLRLVARAWYADGRSEDVTRWAKFVSSEDLVAQVGDDGVVKVTGHGEAGICVLFSNLVAACQVASPLPNSPDPKVFTTAARHNFVDDGVLKKLQELHIPPSPLCSDHEFIRRAFLDAAGILPTPEEGKKFVEDKDPGKRQQLVEGLLKRPEFIDYWTYKWSDLLLVSTRKLPQAAVWSFSQFIRQSVADNKPWDRFAREILTANGSNLNNGAANYFVLHKDVTELTETTAVTFLGMSLTCARCHNHPLEKWTQDQYWSMANLFSRVGLKNGDRGGEVTVQALTTGDVLHLRRGVPMPPTPLDGKPFALESTADRRAYFADWLTSADNPFFAKAMVNRVWRNFMGRGLVEAEDDLRATNPPSNADLLDALTKDFIGHKYDVKHLIQTIMTSAAYQRSSVAVEGNGRDDRFYSHYLIKRLSAEVVLDSYSQVTGVPTPFTSLNVGASGGTQPTTNYPLGTRAMQLPDTLLVSQFLESFGRPDRIQTCSCERQNDSSVGQALHLNNGQTLNDKLRDKNSRLGQWLNEKIDDAEAVRRLFVVGLCREPTAAELSKFIGLMGEAAKEGQGRREVLEDLFWAVLTSKEFLFNR